MWCLLFALVNKVKYEYIELNLITSNLRITRILDITLVSEKIYM